MAVLQRQLYSYSRRGQMRKKYVDGIMRDAMVDKEQTFTNDYT
jgi:hypothetical protein